MITKYGSGDGKVLRDKKKEAAKEEWTAQDQAELVEEQADVLDDGEDSH